jgi:CheY-like chemotaxis protein
MLRSVARHLVVVDDDPDIREALRDLLEREGYAVHSAENGRHALEMIRTLGDAPVILLDLMMPQMNGWQVLDELRRRGSTLPVIVISAAADSTLQREVLRRGAVAVLRKPFELDALMRAVRRYAGFGLADA